MNGAVVYEDRAAARKLSDLARSRGINAVEPLWIEVERAVGSLVETAPETARDYVRDLLASLAQ